jgi:hypothetical protein
VNDGGVVPGAGSETFDVREVLEAAGCPLVPEEVRSAEEVDAGSASA